MAWTTPQEQPFHHVHFSPCYTDRVALQKNKQRGPPPSHWLGEVSSHALEYYHHEISSRKDYSSLRKDFLGIKQVLNKDPHFGARLAATPTRLFSIFNLYSRSIGSAWQPYKKSPKPLNSKEFDIARTSELIQLLTVDSVRVTHQARF